MATRKVQRPAPKKSGRGTSTAKAAPARNAKRAVSKSVWTNFTAAASASAGRRTEALFKLGTAVAESSDSFQQALAVVTDVSKPADLRQATLAAVQATTFDASTFPALRPDYLRALRKLADDPDLEMRQRGLGMLMREGDAPTQQRLLKGLREPDKALLPPEKALQLLAYDMHGDAISVAREIAGKTSSPEVRREALRLLVADGESVAQFESIFRDKSESSEIRRLALTAMQRLAPSRVQTLARDIVVSAAEKDTDLRTSCLVALAQFGSADAIRDDKTLNAHVDRLEAQAADDSAIASAAQQFIGRYR